MAVATLISPDAVGDDAAEAEPPETMAAYFVDKPDFQRFRDSNRPILIVNARKGVGKSALLVYTRHKLEHEHPDDSVVFLTGRDLPGMPEDQVSTADPAALVRDRKRMIQDACIGAHRLQPLGSYR